MSRLDHIETRHGRERWKDAMFVAAALLLTAFSVGMTTSLAVGKADPPTGVVKVIESSYFEIVR